MGIIIRVFHMTTANVETDFEINFSFIHLLVSKIYVALII